jgi:hypothetical protein
VDVQLGLGQAAREVDERFGRDGDGVHGDRSGGMVAVCPNGEPGG